MSDLMNHTAGFQETTWDVEVPDKKDIISLKDALLETAPQQIYEPGTTVSYSNWGAALAAYIVECISGMDYGQYVRQFIFEPLGMNQTSILPDCSDNEWVESRRDLTNAYYNVEGEYEDYGPCRRYILLYPAGAAAGTMNDLVKLAQALLADSKDCPIFTKADTLDKMLSATLYYDGTDTPRICHGLFSQEYGVSLIGHAGNTTGFSANLVLDRENRTGLVIMTNEAGETTYNYGLVSLIYGDCETETGFERDDLSGIYCNSRANYDKSFLKLFSLISGLLPVVKGTDGSYQAAMAGSIHQISKNAVIMDDGNGLKTYMHIERGDDDHVTAFQHMMGMDFQKENTAVFILKIVFFLLFVLSSFWALIMLIVHGLTLYKYKSTALWNRKVYQILAELFIVLAAAVIYWLILPPLMGGSLTKTTVAIKCFLIILFTFIEMVILLLWWFGRKKHTGRQMNTRQKIGAAVTQISGILLIASVLYWHLYQFWGC